MDNDVFEEEAPNEELDMAGKELKRRLESIKTVSFQEFACWKELFKKINFIFSDGISRVL